MTFMIVLFVCMLSLASSPDFPSFSSLRVERTFEGDEFWTRQLTEQCDSSSTAAKTMKQGFVDNLRIALTTVIASSKTAES